jgi:hypothetical protein
MAKAQVFWAESARADLFAAVNAMYCPTRFEKKGGGN